MVIQPPIAPVVLFSATPPPPAEPIWERDFSSASLGDNATCASTGTRTVTDFESIVRTAQDNEARFTGARRVENIGTNPTLEGGPYLPTGWDAVTSGGTFARLCSDNEWEVSATVGRWLGRAIFVPVANAKYVMSAHVVSASNTTVSEVCRLYQGGVLSSSIGRLSTLKAVSCVGSRAFLCDGTPTSTANTDQTYGIGVNTGAGAVGACKIKEYMMERVDGQAVQVPSEWTETVAYYPYRNGNSLDANNKLTIAAGEALTGITLKNGSGDAISWSDVPADNEARLWIDGAAVDVDDWDGDLADAAYYGEISWIKVYEPGERP